jgi:hypothetical protein
MRWRAAGRHPASASRATLLPSAEPATDGRPLATAFKVERGPAGDRIAYLRILSGSLGVRERVAFHRPGRGEDVEHYGKITGIEVFERGASMPVERARAGEIARVWGLDTLQIGDRLGAWPDEASRSTPVLSVPASISQTKAGLTRKATKSEKGRRVSVAPYTLTLLAEHRSRREQLCAALGLTLAPDSYLFSPDPDSGSPWPPRTISQRYRTMAKRLGLRSTRLHSLRHYSATELLAAGVDLRTVAGRLGHGSGGTITLRTYAAWVDHADRRAAETMAGILPRPAPAPPKARGPYQQIAADLREQIATGRLQPGDKLPTVVQLAAEYSVAAGTAHRAIALLAAEGHVDVSRGRRATVVRTEAATGNLRGPS